MSKLLCCKCGKNKKRSSFSKSQLRKSKNKLKCKLCVSKFQNQSNNLQKNPKHSGIDLFNDDPLFDFPNEMKNSIQKQVSKRKEPGQLSFLQKLHQHCLGKTLFTELHLAISFDTSIMDPNILQAIVETRFIPIKDAFVYRDRVIIASVDGLTHMVSYMAVKEHIPYPFIDHDTRLCCNQLLYVSGKISNKGIEFNDQKMTIDNCDISKFISQPLVQVQQVQQVQGVTDHDADEKSFKAKLYKNACSASKKWNNLQADLKRIKVDISHTKMQLCDEKSKMKMIIDDNILTKWTCIRNELIKKSDYIFDTNHLASIQSILASVLVLEKDEYIGIEETEGNCTDIIFTVKTKLTNAITISRNMTNNYFVVNLEKMLSDFAQQFAKNTNDESDDIMSKLVNYGLQANIINCESKLTLLESSFKQCVAEINMMIQNMTQKWDPLQESVLFNYEIPNITLTLTTYDKPFGVYVLQYKAKIMKWISECVDKYEGIHENGVEYLFIQFINFHMNNMIVFWIAVLRVLSLPISIYNMNLLKKHTLQTVEQNPQSDNHLDTVSIIWYCLKETPQIYRSNKFKFTRKDSKNAMFDLRIHQRMEGTQIIKFCNDCLRYVINLISDYKQPSSKQKMYKEIAAYMRENDLLS